jgi:hypothetical protein
MIQGDRQQFSATVEEFDGYYGRSVQWIVSRGVHLCMYNHDVPDVCIVSDKWNITDEEKNMFDGFCKKLFILKSGRYWIPCGARLH